MICVPSIQAGTGPSQVIFNPLNFTSHTIDQMTVLEKIWIENFFKATNTVIVQSFSIIRVFICDPSALLLTLLYLNLEANSWIGNAFPTIPSASSIYFSPILKRKHTHLTYVSHNIQSIRTISWHSFSQNVEIFKSSSLHQQHTKQQASLFEKKMVCIAQKQPISFELPFFSSILLTDRGNTQTVLTKGILIN